MEFPVYISIGPLALHPHAPFELLGSAVGFRVFLALRARHTDPMALEVRLRVLIGTVLGAYLGAKLLHQLANPAALLAHGHEIAHWFSGRTIVGALLGGWIAAEGTKRILGVRQRTGDLYAVPLCFAIAIGRIGCFLSGLDDLTYGIPTDLPLGIDFGDGTPRHAPQLYEIAFLLTLAPWLYRQLKRPHVEGMVFRQFLVAYLSFRFVVDFLKPYETLGPLQGIQWACFAAVLFHAARWRQLKNPLESAT